MGTSWSARLVAAPETDLAAVEAAIAAALAGVVAEMSDWEAESDVGRFNRAAPGAWQPLPPDLFAVLDHGLALAEATGGAFDPTAGRLVELWGFGPTPAAKRPPEAQAIEAARAAGGWRRLGIDRDRRAARQPGGLRLDLSAIAKGFGVDAAAAAIRAAGIAHFLVEVGGELHGSGVKPDGLPWWVEIEQPPGADLRPIVAALHGLAVATSGSYRRYFEADGRRFAHSLDPRTGWPVDNGVASVTVLAPSCMAADAMATALTVLGPDSGLRFASERGVAAYFVIEAAGGYIERMTPAFGAMLD
jgi:thiamine biosynthesis lipoprotein